MLDKSRIVSKKISKENVLRCVTDRKKNPAEPHFVHAGPSEYIRCYNDNKHADFDIEMEGFMGSKVTLTAHLSVEDSPNSAGVVIDAVRFLMVARNRGMKGALCGASAYTQKTPPKNMTFDEAYRECEELAKI